jgi:phosphoglycolate phosphatase
MYEMVLENYSSRPARLSKVYPGIPELLDRLKLQSIPLIVYTNKAQLIAEDVIRSFFPAGTFRTVLGYTGEYPHKPDPSALSAYLAGESTPASRILMVGDTPVDLETAVNACIDFAGASWGFKSAEILEAAGSVINFPGADALARWLFD